MPTQAEVQKMIDDLNAQKAQLPPDPPPVVVPLSLEEASARLIALEGRVNRSGSVPCT